MESLACGSVAVLATCGGRLAVAVPALRVQSHYLRDREPRSRRGVSSLLSNRTSPGGASGISKIPPLVSPGLDLSGPRDYYYLVALALILVVGFALFIANTTLGPASRRCETTCSPRPPRLEIRYYRLMAFLLAGLVGGVAGVLYAHKRRYVSPDTSPSASCSCYSRWSSSVEQDSIWAQSSEPSC